ncbi:exo-alpha-sialidase [Fulvivirga sp. M361]|uniref:exo-alpha-sialidase n=1 Tax=Fulvivirga sp. M361 TaxID=2594266 RepID=UPI00117B456B|nr:exo-alpha-sialidase [Fulvivirga sp. M361]TRX48400.1 exo-alpha-sialidase [Fulvivirga sp. M361]
MFKVLIFPLLIGVVSCVSGDSGLATTIPSPAAINSEEPYLLTTPQGNTYLSWIERNDTLGILRYAQYRNGQWTKPVSITNGSNWFINWADYPMMAVNKTDMIAHTLTKSGQDTYAYDISLFHSEDGKDWRSAGLLNEDGLQAEHGFVTMLPYKDGFLLSWLDGRNTVSMMDSILTDHAHHKAMTLRAAILTSSGKKMEEWELDNRVCDCCQTSGALTANGPVIVYRNRSEKEVRDISIVRYESGTWTKPSVIFNDLWLISGCPVNGPRADAKENVLAVAWFTAAKGNASVKVAFSKNSGKSFTPPVIISDASPLGRVDVLLIDQRSALVSWMEGSEIRVMKVTVEGISGTSVFVAQSSGARASGFPQMTRYKDRVLFAWTDEEQKKVQLAALDMNDLM